MAWDTEGTKRKLLDAATAEFAEHGPDGTTMARIGRRAGVNKERLYNYFGGKDELFARVLAQELNKAAAAVPLAELTSPDDVGAYAASLYDYHRENPLLSRLFAWEGLTSESHAPVPDEEQRTGYYAQKVAAFRHAQEAGVIDDSIPAESQAFLVITMALSWHTLPQMARMYHHGSASDPRVSVARAATAMTRP